MKIGNKLSRIEKKVLLAEAFFVFGVFIYLFFVNSPNQIYPLQGMVISEPDFVFEIENGEEIMLSTGEDFENFITLQEGSEITLEPGEYYWKAVGGFRESEVKSFVVDEVVGLDIKEREEDLEIKNSGNVDLNVTKNKEVSFEIGVDEVGYFEKENVNFNGEKNGV